MSQAVNNETWNVVTSQADVKYMIAFGLLGRNIIFWNSIIVLKCYHVSICNAEIEPQ